jgi:hypothetical protein
MSKYLAAKIWKVPICSENQEEQSAGQTVVQYWKEEPLNALGVFHGKLDIAREVQHDHRV